MSKRVTLPTAGAVFGYLTVESPIAVTMMGGRRHIWCSCKCGNRKLVQPCNLWRGFVLSCGCLPRQIVLERNQRLATHRQSNTPEFRAWQGLLTRCYAPTNKYFPRYGGRGIAVCERWRESFENFLADMGPRPGPRHSIDRYPDNNGPYCKENCRWATYTQQLRNTRQNHLLTINGETGCVSEWAELRGIPSATVFSRLARGLSPEEALDG